MDILVEARRKFRGAHDRVMRRAGDRFEVSETRAGALERQGLIARVEGKEGRGNGSQPEASARPPAEQAKPATESPLLSAPDRPRAKPISKPSPASKGDPA
jgi:hypothetical protein